MDQPKGEGDKNDSIVDKIIMGAIIGTAIGSAIGVTMAPKKGVETRSAVKEQMILSKETAGGFYRLFKNIIGRILFGKKKIKSDMKALPDEMEIIPPKRAEP